MRSLLRISSVVLFGCALGCAVGCEGDPQPLGWEIEFEDSALLSRATVVEAVILEGGCDGGEVLSTEVVMGEPSSVVIPVLADGPWGFVGRARDATCAVFAEGCTQVILPTPGPIVVVLMARATEVSACSLALCDGGRCSETSVDAGVVDACTGTETVCDDGMDNDCNGDTDCADAACVDDSGCEACATVTCGACEVCRAGECFASEDETACGDGTCWSGNCCTGCWDEISCRLGDTIASCGARGQRCASCEGCGICTDGACVETTPDLTPCAAAGAAAGGFCTSGICCSGCLDGAGGCALGDAPSACGVGGVACMDCGAECGTCTAGVCGVADGTPCTAGICRLGVCCDGCWDGVACQGGTEGSACGIDGTMCNPCLPCESCDTLGVCTPGTVGDSCTSVSSLLGRCQGALLECCTGCWDGAACQPGTRNMVCGTLGNVCQVCGGATSCGGGFCR